MTGFSLHSCMGNGSARARIHYALSSALSPLLHFASSRGMLHIETLLGFVFKASKTRNHFSISVSVASSVYPTTSNYMI